MKHPEKVSPSALKTFIECPRKRLFRDVDGIKPPPAGPWLEQGTRMHAHLENARMEGTMPDQTDPESRVASAAIQYWDPGPWLPEQPIEIDRGDFVYFGYSDQLDRESPEAFVGDYKFTGSHHNLPRPGKLPFWWQERKNPRLKDPERIELAAQVLQDDPQWVIYGYSTERETVRGRWTYVVKPPKMEGNPKVLPVDLRATREELEEKIETFDVAARDLVRMRRTLKTANDAPHNADSACGGLGIGCEFAEYCERKEENMGQLTVEELLAGVKQQTEGPKAAPEEATPHVRPQKPVEELIAEANKEPQPAAVQDAEIEEPAPPKVNPPEGKEADTQATIEQVPESPGKGRRKKKSAKKTAKKDEPEPEESAPAPIEFESQIVSATYEGVIELAGLPGCVVPVIPVGARVKVTVL